MAWSLDIMVKGSIYTYNTENRIRYPRGPVQNISSVPCIQLTTSPSLALTDKLHKQYCTFLLNRDILVQGEKETIRKKERERKREKER